MIMLLKIDFNCIFLASDFFETDVKYVFKARNSCCVKESLAFKYCYNSKYR